jgi:ribosomal protein L7/L12
MNTWTVILLVAAAVGVVLALSGSSLQERRATAVRVYRRLTGASLLEAKRAVDRIAAGD